MKKCPRHIPGFMASGLNHDCGLRLAGLASRPLHADLMDAHLMEFLSMLVRWLHVIAGIAWIGSSFYFIWLDNSLEAPPAGSDAAKKGVAGELWAVHGGGFYNPQKYAVAPPLPPDKLHWFKWEAYTTWLSGTALLAVVYWLRAQVMMIDPMVAAIAPTH